MTPLGLVLKMAIGGADKFIKFKEEPLKLSKTKIKNFELNEEQLKALKFLKMEKKFRCFCFTRNNWIRKNPGIF